MKKIILLMICILLISSQMVMAVTINTPWAPDTPSQASEVNLYAIINGWTGLSLNSGSFSGCMVQETLPEGPYRLLNYATYAGFSQTLTVPGTGILASTPPSYTNQSMDIPFTENNIFGFTDTANSLTLTTVNQNVPNQSNGFIIPLYQFNPALVGQYIIAFEDGSGSPYGDSDYNDMVGRVSSVPLPPSTVLLGSGLFGIIGLRWSRKKY